MQISSQLGSKRYEIKAKLDELYGSTVSAAVLDKTGPTCLWHTAPNENTFTLSQHSIMKLINEHSIDLNDIDNLISVTETPVLSFPGNAPLLASSFPFRKNISTYDLNSGCTGFVDALKIGFGLKTPSLIVCSETYSKHIHKFNRATSSLFSDGASAIYLDPRDWELLDTHSLIKFNSFKCISVANKDVELVMEGKEVYNFVASDVTPELIKIFSKNNLIDRTYLHQGSKLVVEFLASRLKKYNTKLPTNISEIGNLVSATIPILIQEDVNHSPIKSGETILVAGFGVGLSFSACVLRKK